MTATTLQRWLPVEGATDYRDWEWNEEVGGYVLDENTHPEERDAQAAARAIGKVNGVAGLRLIRLRPAGCRQQ